MKLADLIKFNLNKFKIPENFTPPSLKYANGLKEPSKADFKGREDLRKKPLCTIDGVTSRDFDDAVFCERWHKDGFHLIVAIADVAYYVHENTPLDKDAYLRGTSVYYPEVCIPMLPEAISNGLCSLKPNVDRLALSMHIYLDGKGNIKRKHVNASIIHSHARLTYEEAQRHMDGEKTNIPHKVQNSLVQLERLYKIRRKKKAERYSFELDSDDTKFIFENGVPIQVVNPKSLDSHKLIEECMILANVSASLILEENKELCVNRYHAPPSGKKLENLDDLVSLYGLTPLSDDGDVTPKDLWNYVHAVPESIRPQFKRSLLRTYEKAFYCPDNKGHFGLALGGYVHFTSPIRRYPDLIIHRLLYRCLKLPGWRKAGTKVNLQKLRKQCEHLSNMERRAKDSGFTLHDQLTTSYYMRLSGNHEDATAGVYDAKVLAIHKKNTTGGALKATGLLVSFDNDIGRATVALSGFNDGFYVLGKDGNSLVNSETKSRIKIGTKLKIKLKSFNVESGYMTAAPITQSETVVTSYNGKIGETAEGVIYQITNSGIQLRLNETNADAFIPMRLLKDDFYLFNKKDHALKGKNHKKVFKNGMIVQVRVKGTNKRKTSVICEIV